MITGSEPSRRDRNTYYHQKSGLDPELFIDLLVLDRVASQLLVETVALGCFDNTRGEDLKREVMGWDHRNPSDIKWLLTGSFPCCAQFKT